MRRHHHDKSLQPFLNAQDLGTQITRMVAFIEHEAKERVEDIDAKAEGEYCYEKGRLLHAARQDMNRQYEKKEKIVLKQAQIDAATLRNQARLKELAVREAHVAGVEAEVQDRLLQKNRDRKLYKDTLEQMLIQALFRMMETEVIVRVMEKDCEMAETLLEPVAKKYLEVIGKKVDLMITTDRFLPPSSLGGVELLTPSYKIRVTNTFHSRLQLIVRQLVPQIRRQLFGYS